MDDIDTSGWTPEQIEEYRVEQLTSPLFDLFLRFERAFTRLAIDKLDITDADAESAAAVMGETEGGRAFAHFLRRIKGDRCMRVLGARAVAVFAAGAPECMTFEEINERYAKLHPGSA